MAISIPTGRKGACQEMGMGYLRGYLTLTRFMVDNSWLNGNPLQPKFEYRNPKFETNTNIECSNDKNQQIENRMFLPLRHSGFLVIVSYFEIRIS
jgi:hypothetical protein